jgi:hypothetical protein
VPREELALIFQCARLILSDAGGGVLCDLPQEHLQGRRDQILRKMQHEVEVSQRGYDIKQKRTKHLLQSDSIIGGTAILDAPSLSSQGPPSPQFRGRELDLASTFGEADGETTAAYASLNALALSVRIGTRKHGVGAQGLYPFVRLRPNSRIFQQVTATRLKPLRESSVLQMSREVERPR